MKNILLLLLGFNIGLGTVTAVKIVKDTYFNKAKYEVGDCLSNGLFPERILEIRNTRIGLIYITIGTIDGKLTLPNNVYTWIADENWSKVDNRYCK